MKTNKTIMPQEIQVWYLIPALRRAFAKIFVKEMGLSKRKAAGILNVSEAAVSQYFSFKRAKKIKFSERISQMIKKSAQKIIDNPKDLLKEIYFLCDKITREGVICDLHKKKDKSVPESCDICFR